MSNFILSYRNRADEGTLSGGRFFTSAPASEMQNTDVQRRARTAGATARDTWFQCDLGDEELVRLAALVNHSIAQGPTYRLRAANSPVVAAADVTFTASDNSINTSSTSLAGFTVGETLHVSGSDDNDGTSYTIATVAANKITVAETIVDESPAATKQVKLLQKVEYDSGVLDVWPDIFPSDQLDIEDDNFMTGYLPATDIPTRRNDLIHLAPTNVLARYWLWEIFTDGNNSVNISATDISAAASDDSFNSTSTNLAVLGDEQRFTVAGFSNAANNGQFIADSPTATKAGTTDGTLVDESAGATITITAGFIDIGRLWLGPVFSPTRNFSYGNSIGVVDTTDVEANRYGREFINEGVRYRVLKLPLENMSNEEAHATLMEIYKRTGIAKEVFIIRSPDDVELKHQHSFLARLPELSEIVNTSFNRHAAALILKEVI